MDVKERLKLKTPTQFSLMIEKLSRELKVGMMETVLHYCEREGMEVEAAAKLLNASVKGKVQVEAEDLNYLPKSARLPL